MKNLPRIAIVVVGVLAVVYGAFQVYSGLGLGGPSVDRDRMAAAEAAAAAITERFQAANPAGEPPRASDPAVARDLASLFDVGYVLGLETLPISEGAALGGWNVAASKVGLAYLLWGTGKSDVAEAVADAAAVARINANTAAYSPEVGGYIDFSLAATSAVARSTAAHLAGLSAAEREAPDVASGTRSVREGFAQAIGGTIELFALPGLTDDWLAARLPTLQAVKETAAAFLFAEEWRAIADRAEEIAGATPNAAIADGLRGFAQNP
jgi:hypothetical protein